MFLRYFSTFDNVKCKLCDTKNPIFILSPSLTLHHQLGFGRVLPDLDAVGALVLHHHLLDHQSVGAAISQDLHPIRGSQHLFALVPGGAAARRGNGAFQDHAVSFQGRSVS